MDPDDLKASWQGQGARTRLAIDAERLIEEVRRDERSFAATIFWRDFREVGVSLLMVPVWIFLGIRNASPWTWYLAIPAMLWIAGFLLVDRMRHRRRPPGPAEPLRRCVESLLAQVEHQIGLLRRVFWWYLLPLGLAMLAFFGQVSWRDRGGGWWTALGFSIAVAIQMGVFAFIYWLNQYAVRASLEPRRRELQSMLASLEDEAPGAG